MISNSYKEQLKLINGQGNFGKRKNLPKFLEDFIVKEKPESILDFGCGVGSLVKTLKIKYPNKKIQGYDPGNINYSHNIEKEKFDLIISTDVLEHIEPDHLEETLLFLKRRSKKFYHLIALGPSKMFLPDGRNSHLIIETQDWWKEKFNSLGFTITFEKHMFHKKEDKIVNKYFVAGFC